MAKIALKAYVLLPPVPRTLALDTPGVESRINIADVPPRELQHIADEWGKALMAKAEEIRAERAAKA